MKNQETRTIGEALYVINKEAKSLRDVNDKLFASLEGLKEEREELYNKIEESKEYIYREENDRYSLEERLEDEAEEDKDFLKEELERKNNWIEDEEEELKQAEEEFEKVKGKIKETWDDIDSNKHAIKGHYNKKEEVLEKLIELKKAEIKGYHVFTNDCMTYVVAGGWGFHSSYIESETNLGRIEGKISAKKEKTTLKKAEAKKIIENFLKCA